MYSGGGLNRIFSIAEKRRQFVARWIGLVVLSLTLLGCAKRLEPSMVPDEIHQAQTEDGWTLPVRRYEGDGPTVILMHGMAANHTNWDFRPEVSPVDELVEAGYDVWVPSLRGDGGTTPPRARGRTRIDFDDHAILDVPAILQVIDDKSPGKDRFWVGHSMGGMLLYTTLIRQPDWLTAGIAIASPAAFEHPIRNHKVARALGFFFSAGRGRIPMRPFAPMLVGSRLAVKQVGNPDLLDRAIVAGMAKYTLQNLPRATARQARRWLLAREFVDRSGDAWLPSVTENSAPIMVLGAPGDHIASEPDVAAACEKFSHCIYGVLGKSQGFAGDYGHIDPIVGKTAPDEVYPMIFRFLGQNGGIPTAN